MHALKDVGGIACSLSKTKQCREKRVKEKLKRLEEKVHSLTTAINEYQKLLSERNSKINHLKSLVKQLKLENDILRCDLDEKKYENEATISELKEELEKCQQNTQLQTFSSGTYNPNIKELYYSLLSLRIPPAQIKPIVQNVLKYLLSSLNGNKLRLPGKSCASYMRSSEVSVLSTMHKAAELSKQPEWHLNSDGTTLNQTKKVAFLINDLVLGVRDVSDGSAQTTLDALKAELCKLSIETESDTKAIQNIVSSMSDGVSTQAKFNDLLQNEVGENLVENKCIWVSIYGMLV